MTVELLELIYRTGKVETADGQAIDLAHHIARDESNLLADVIKSDPTIERTLEVGCAYGLSSLTICDALSGRPNAHHTILDPFQFGWCRGIGVANLQRADFKNYELREERSELAMPKMVETSQTFDMIFIDGWHTFDQTLVDCYFATRLLRVGGYLVVDDANLKPVRRAVGFVSQYPCYRQHRALFCPVKRGWKARTLRELVATIPALRGVLSNHIRDAIEDQHSMVALQKIAEDNRDWDWHADP